MGRPRIGTELKKPSDYTYDYPENREVSKHLTPEDKIFIVHKTGYSYTHIYDWCRGRRRSKKIEFWANRIAKINKDKEQKLLKINPDYERHDIPVQTKTRITA